MEERLEFVISNIFLGPSYHPSMLDLTPDMTKGELLWMMGGCLGLSVGAFILLEYKGW